MLCLGLAVLANAQSKTITDSYILETSSNFQGALDVMQDLSAADPGDAFYQIRIAWLQYLLGSYPESILSYRKAILLKDNLDAHLGLINCQLALARYPDAIQEADLLLAVHQQNPLLLGKAGYAAYMLKDYALAAKYYAQSLQIYPWDMETRGYLVNNLYLSGKVAEAKSEYLLLKKYYPQSAVITQYKSVLE